MAPLIKAIAFLGLLAPSVFARPSANAYTNTTVNAIVNKTPCGCWNDCTLVAALHGNAEEGANCPQDCDPKYQCKDVYPAKRESTTIVKRVDNNLDKRQDTIELPCGSITIVQLPDGTIVVIEVICY